MASTRARLFVAVMVAAVLATAHGASYTVGAPAGSWDLRTNYTVWTSSITFQARDQLVFNYSRAAHNVVEVGKAGYDSCSSSSPIATYQTGNDTVPLPTGGVTRYFICGVPGHCTAGMKLAVTVRSADDSCRNRRSRQRLSTGRRARGSRLCNSDSDMASSSGSARSVSSMLVIMVLLTIGLML